MTSTQTPDSPGPRTVSTAGRVLHVAAVATTLLVTALLGAALLPNAWGWSSMVVTSGSMEPALHPGDVVLVQPGERDSFAPLDIITFTSEDGDRVTHRVVERSTDPDGTSYVTKGDANEEVDPGVVDSRNVVGQVRYSVPAIGYVIAWARTPLGLGLLALGLGYVAFGGRGRRDAAGPGAGGRSDASRTAEPAPLVST